MICFAYFIKVINNVGSGFRIILYYIVMPYVKLRVRLGLGTKLPMFFQSLQQRDEMYSCYFKNLYLKYYITDQYY